MKTSHDSKSYLPCSHIVRKASPRGKKTASSLSRKRLMRGDKSALFIGMYLSTKTERHAGRSLQYHVLGWCCLIRSALYRGAIRKEQPAYRLAHPTCKTGATAARCKNALPPKTNKKTSPESTRTVQSETNLCHVQAGALGGSSR